MAEKWLKKWMSGYYEMICIKKQLLNQYMALIIAKGIDKSSSANMNMILNVFLSYCLRINSNL